MDDEMEEWRDIEGTYYQVSNLGRVRSTVLFRGIEKDGIIEPVIQNGYPAVTLRGARHNRNYVHRLVAAAFLGPCPAGCVVHHRDGNRADPRLSNLEYRSRSSHTHHHFIQECAALAPGRPGGGMSMFDRSKGYQPG